MKLSVGKKIGAGFLVALFVVIVFGSFTYLNTQEMVRASELRKHSFES